MDGIMYNMSSKDWMVWRVKKIACLVLGLFLLIACKDADVKAFENYLYNLSELQTHNRAAQNIYNDAKGKNEKARSTYIKAKVLPQFQKYRAGLEKLEPGNDFLIKLNKKGVDKTQKSITYLTQYYKLLLERSTHDVLKSRKQADDAIDDLNDWLVSVKGYAREKGLSMPEDRIKR